MNFCFTSSTSMSRRLLTISKHSISKLWSWNAPYHFSSEESATPIPFLT